MTLYDKRKKKLTEELQNKDYRDAFVAESINIGLAFQIRAIREEQDLSQAQLGERVRPPKTQPEISRFEDPNYGKLSLTTLKKLASALEVGLLVKFVPLSELVERELKLSPASLKAVKFQNDPYFNGDSGQTASEISNKIQYVNPSVTEAANAEIPKNVFEETDNAIQKPSLAYA